jgi:hypothetical protein
MPRKTASQWGSKIEEFKETIRKLPFKKSGLFLAVIIGWLNVVSPIGQTNSFFSDVQSGRGVMMMGEWGSPALVRSSVDISLAISPTASISSEIDAVGEMPNSIEQKIEPKVENYETKLIQPDITPDPDNVILGTEGITSDNAFLDGHHLGIDGAHLDENHLDENLPADIIEPVPIPEGG